MNETEEREGLQEPPEQPEPPRVRSSSRMDVVFVGAGPDQKIDARCSGGKVQAEVEV